MLATLWETFRNGIQVNQRQRIPESETIALNSTGTTLILTVLRGPQAGTRFTFAAPATFTIGRDVMAEMSLPSDPYSEGVGAEAASPSDFVSAATEFRRAFLRAALPCGLSSGERDFAGARTGPHDPRPQDCRCRRQSGASLAEVVAQARAVAASIRTMGVALSPRTVPAASQPGFVLGDQQSINQGVG